MFTVLSFLDDLVDFLLDKDLFERGHVPLVFEVLELVGEFPFQKLHGVFRVELQDTSSYSDLDWTKPIELTIKFDPSGAGFCHVTYLVNGVEAVSYDTSENTMRTTKWGSSINMYYGADLESGTDGSAILEWMEYTAPMNWDE